MSKRNGSNGRARSKPYIHPTSVFNLRLPHATLAKLKKAAERETRTMTNLARVLIEQGLERRAS
jgi:hypothetical protein